MSPCVGIGPCVGKCMGPCVGMGAPACVSMGPCVDTWAPVWVYGPLCGHIGPMSPGPTKTLLFSNMLISLALFAPRPPQISQYISQAPAYVPLFPPIPAYNGLMSPRPPERLLFSNMFNIFGPVCPQVPADISVYLPNPRVYPSACPVFSHIIAPCPPDPRNAVVFQYVQYLWPCLPSGPCRYPNISPRPPRMSPYFPPFPHIMASCHPDPPKGCCFPIC